MTRLLITGALGHIGSRLIHALTPGSFDEVVLVDNLSAQRVCSTFNLPAGVPFRFIEADVCTADIDSLLVGVGVVLHLAAITNAAGSFEIQEHVERVNFDGTRRVAEACVRAGARLLFPSTTSVYGTQESTVDEACSLADLQPQSPYASSKLKAEQLLETMGREQGLQFFIGRFGTVYGTSIGMRFHTAINKFCWQATTGEPLTVWRTAIDQYRPYLDVADAVRAIHFVIDNDLFDGRIYNVLTENATVRTIVDIIREEIPDVEVRYVETRIMNQLSYRVSAQRVAAAGFTPAGSMRSGIAETLHLLSGIRAGRLAARSAED